MTRMIDSFTGKYGFLSNFSPHSAVYCNVFYATAEHAFQGHKALIAGRIDKHDEVLRIRESQPGKAKRTCNRHNMPMPQELVEYWNDMSYRVMLDIVRSKFSRNSWLKRQLLLTGDTELIEGNNWGDDIWGCIRDSSNGWTGENKLGEILMQVREELG